MSQFWPIRHKPQSAEWEGILGKLLLSFSALNAEVMSGAATASLRADKNPHTRRRNRARARAGADSITVWLCHLKSQHDCLYLENLNPSSQATIGQLSLLEGDHTANSYMLHKRGRKGQGRGRRERKDVSIRASLPSVQNQVISRGSTWMTAGAPVGL